MAVGFHHGGGDVPELRLDDPIRLTSLGKSRERGVTTIVEAHVLGVSGAKDRRPAFEANLPQDVRNMAAEEARASFDHRHRFVASLTYALPDLGSGAFVSKLGSGWQVNGIVLLESGAPFTVNLGTDRANIGAGPAQRPDQTCDPNTGGVRTAQQWFNTNCFTLQPQFTFGNAPRNSVLAPGYASVDVGLQKDVALGNDTRLQLRWEIFNVLNRTNFDVPNRVAFTPNFGRIFSAKPPRQTQFGVKVLF